MQDPRKLGRAAMGYGVGAVCVLALSSSALAQMPTEAPYKPDTSQHYLYNRVDKALAITTTGATGGVAPKGAEAPNPDPHTLEGHWWTVEIKHMFGPAAGTPPPLKPKYMAKLETRIRNKNSGIPEADASTQCFPHGVPRAMESPYPLEIIQTPGQITVLMETLHNIRRIYMADHHDRRMGISFLGDSVAHWEGDVLVVDTTKLNDRTFLDDEGSFHSTREHVVERIQKIDGGARLKIVNTIDDPVTLERATSYTTYYNWRPDVKPQEYICEENNRNKVVNGITVAK